MFIESSKSVRTLTNFEKDESKKSQKPWTKNFGQRRDSNPRPSALQTSKNPDKPMPRGSRSSKFVWQLEEATAYKASLV